MNRLCQTCGLLCGCLFLLLPRPASGADPDAIADALESLSHASRAIGRAGDAIQDARDAVTRPDEPRRHGDPWPHGRHWENSRRERDRVRDMSAITGVRESKIRALRRHGLSWDEIADRYDAHSRRSAPRWRGSGHIPPGQAKKMGARPRHPEKHHCRGRD